MSKTLNLWAMYIDLYTIYFTIVMRAYASGLFFVISWSGDRVAATYEASEPIERNKTIA
jgi:hypothetical protein